MPRRKKIKPVALKDVVITDDGKLKKAITTAPLGNAIEWFDFGAHGFVAYALGKVFFPDTDPSVQMIIALGISSVPLLVRSLGGLFFGMSGDKYGRQKILAVTVAIMSISTFCIGLILSHVTIGIWALILLLLCKMARGFSVGSEYTGASIFVARYPPDRKRGFMGSWLDFNSIAGFMMGAGVVVLVSSVVGGQSFLDQGWCVPFFLALPLDIIGLYLCHALEKTPVFQQHVDTMEQGDHEGLQDGPRAFFKEIAAKHWHSLLTCIGLMVFINVTYYMLPTYMPSYLPHNLHYPEDHEVLIVITIMIGTLFVWPVIGILNDHFGHHPLILIGNVALFALATSAFIMINNGVIGLIFAGLLLLAAVLSYFIGVMASSLPAMPPAHVHSSALTSTFNISVLVVGLIPTLTAWLVKTTQDLIMPAYYLMVIAVAGMTTGPSVKETANRSLKGVTPVTPGIQEAKEILGEHYDSIEQKIEDIDQEIADLQAKRSHLT